MLEALGVCNNRLTGKSVSVIVDNLNIENLSHIDFSDNDIRGSGTDALCRLFTKKNSVQILEISQCKIKLRDFSRLCVALAHDNCKLSDLCISKNLLNSTSAEELSKVLMKNKCPLKWIDASWNCFESTGAMHIAEALKENRSLKYLDLSSNSVRDVGGQSLAAALEFNRTLETLMLALNNIKFKACFVFSRVRNHIS
jgi:Ran GTPase-activating protein (RanGAP) involved in mRNA processing and transport